LGHLRKRLREGCKMGFFSSAMDIVGDAVDSIFGGSSSSSSSRSSNVTTMYEPDKVRVEELRKENNKLMIDGQKEIIELNAKMKIAMIEAEAKGFEYISNILTKLTKDMNIIAQQRLELLENGHIDIVERIENMYQKLYKEIREDSEKFNLDTLPSMLEMLNKFDKDSSSHRLYEKSIEKQIELNMNFFQEKISALLKRQQSLIDSSIQSKEQILSHSAKIVEDRMLFLQSQIKQTSTNPIDTPIIEQKDKLLLTNTKEVNL